MGVGITGLVASKNKEVTSRHCREELIEFVYKCFTNFDNVSCSWCINRMDGDVYWLEFQGERHDPVAVEPDVVDGFSICRS